ncbi:MAG TPA: type II toxin-antitoxin system VapC family toxin [Pyrinomonadaceae bacterium]|nr:type II toxin-antitoxin system VapC family toxin [Pyrinomonadaceae bacterium]
MNKLFLDTSFAIAVASKKDASHRRAKVLAQKIKENNLPILTTQAILLEIGNALSRLKYRQIGIGLLKSLEADRNATIISLTDELYNKAFELFSNRPDKEWGLVDCISFVVMRERKITQALTADEHFIQAGFHALLREI